MTDPRSFGAWLRRERERRAISLRAISDRTKIGAGLLEALERGDVSRWPGGIYRRSFMRSYADMIGLDAELVIANFERLFPDPEAARVAEPAFALAPTGDQGGMRLQLAGAANPIAAWKDAGREVGFAVAFGVLGFVAAGALGFWCATAVAALVYRVCGILGMRHPRPPRAAPPPVEAPALIVQPVPESTFAAPGWVNDLADMVPPIEAAMPNPVQRWNVQ
jgi:transcriptional regulator with XRE-family HTH domain